MEKDCMPERNNRIRMEMSRGLSDRGLSADKDRFHVVSLSGGKDSTALLLLMIEYGMPIDAVITADTGMEFPEMYAHLKKLDAYLYRERGLHITTLRHPEGFEWMMFERPVNRRSGQVQKGYGWPLARPGRRWCTGHLKTHLISKEVNRLKKEKNAVHYVGIAADEACRCRGEQYPLVDWGITEAEALQICYDWGFHYDGLYEIYRRASCWCCPHQRIDGLRKLRIHHSELWERLLDLDRRAREQFGDSPLGHFKEKWTVEELDERFAGEENRVA